MVHGYHLILPMYGFWLPNDPRGSWSDYVRSWELARFGKATRSPERKQFEELTDNEVRLRDASKRALKFPPVLLTGVQAAAVGRGFATKIAISGYTVWACSILPDHTHVVIARHSYKVETIANLLKGSATRELNENGLHPFEEFRSSKGKLPPMWAAQQWKVYLDNETAIDEAIHYVESNPEKEGKPAQNWSFVTPFTGLARGGHTTYR